MPLSAGNKLGPYEILAPLGAGGMGEVYRAKDSRLGREVAVKVLPERFVQTSEALRRFNRGGQNMSLHCHIRISSCFTI